FPSASQFPAAPAPLAGSPPAPLPPQRESGEYTRMFGPGTLPGAPGPVPAAPSTPQSAVSPASYGPGGGATQAFRATPGYPPAAVPPQGPSEYTRMMSVPSNLAPPPPAATSP